MSQGCSVLIIFCRMSLFNVKTARAANTCGELAIQESFDILVPDPVQGFLQNPGE